MSGLEGVNVLELGTMASAAYATKLMADLGANVINGRVSGSGLASEGSQGQVLHWHMSLLRIRLVSSLSVIDYVRSQGLTIHFLHNLRVTL